MLAMDAEKVASGTRKAGTLDPGEESAQGSVKTGFSGKRSPVTEECTGLDCMPEEGPATGWRSSSA